MICAMICSVLRRPAVVISANCAIAAYLISALPAVAEDWTDNTGKFRIEAEYVGVEGKNVLLRKEDGSTISVPIARLSEESRTQAKQLYERSKQADQAGTRQGSNAADVTGYEPSSRFADLVAPAPPSIPAMEPFPADPSLQQQLDYVKEQALAGHLEVFWHCLPEDIRMQLNSEEFRNIYRDHLKDSAAQNRAFEETLAKLVEVLTTKKEFVLGSSMLANAPPELLPLIRKGYDPAVGALYEFLSLTAALDNMDEAELSKIVHYHLPRLGAHLQALLDLVPPDQVDPMLDAIVVQQSGSDTGTLTAPSKDGQMKTIDMVLHSGRWLPRPFVELWTANKDTFLAQAEEQAKQVGGELSDSNPPEVATALQSVGDAANRSLDDLLAAESQQQFDQVLMQTFQQALMIGSTFGAGPGGPGPAAGPGSEAPGGFGPANSEEIPAFGEPSEQ